MFQDFLSLYRKKQLFLKIKVLIVVLVATLKSRENTNIIWFFEQCDRATKDTFLKLPDNQFPQK